MGSGFLIKCLNCGQELTVQPGRRNFRSESITFGTDNYGSDHMTCDCGNAIEERSHFEPNANQEEFVVEWRDISK